MCDLGGVGLFSLGAAAFGMAAVLVDDFGDQVNVDYREDALAAHRKYGVRVLSTDMLTKDLGLEPRSLDADNLLRLDGALEPLARPRRLSSD